ncbi:hypothetical protein FQR65_LT20879 [Abscondita terminalis]|nr:hypothetical protein FQR65_LT20879 [Abscondita terminalis]
MHSTQRATAAAGDWLPNLFEAGEGARRNFWHGTANSGSASGPRAFSGWIRPRPDAQPDRLWTSVTPSYVYQNPIRITVGGGFSIGLYARIAWNGHIDNRAQHAGHYVRSLYCRSPGPYVDHHVANDGCFCLARYRAHPFPQRTVTASLSAAHCILERRGKATSGISTQQRPVPCIQKDLLAYATAKAGGVTLFSITAKESGFNTTNFNGGCQPCGVKWPRQIFSFPLAQRPGVGSSPIRCVPNFPTREIFPARNHLDGRPLEFADTLRCRTIFGRITFFCFHARNMGNFNNLYARKPRCRKTAAKDYLGPPCGATMPISFTTLPPAIPESACRKTEKLRAEQLYYKTVVCMFRRPFGKRVWFMALMGIVFLLAVLLPHHVAHTLRAPAQRGAGAHHPRRSARTCAKRYRRLRRSQIRWNANRRLQQKNDPGVFASDLKSPLLYLMLPGKKLYESLRAHTRKLLDSVQINVHSCSTCPLYRQFFELRQGVFPQ